MKQLDAVNTVLSHIIKDSSVRAVFLKGSIARGEMDEFSDVDFYCLVKENELDSFLNRRIEYMEKYRPLIFTENANFVGPQIVGVYDNGLHFDLYTVTYDTLHHTDEIKVLFDPENLLSDYSPQNFALTEEGILGYFNEISFTMLEFEAAYCRNDLLWASRLGSHISGYIAIILRSIYDKENTKLGFKRLHKKLDANLYTKFADAMDLLGPSYLPKGVQALSEITKEIIATLPTDVSGRINMEFFNYMLDKINKL